MLNIAVLVSGGGTNLQALIDAQNGGRIKNGKIALVVSSNAKAYALERAAKAEIPSRSAADEKALLLSRTTTRRFLALLDRYQIGLDCSCGFSDHHQ